MIGIKCYQTGLVVLVACAGCWSMQEIIIGNDTGADTDIDGDTDSDGDVDTDAMLPEG